MIYIKEPYREIFRDKVNLADFLAIDGERLREVKNRCTIRFCCDDKTFYIKSHTGVGWPEIFKNLIRGQLPVLGAETEWIAIEKIEKLGIATTTAVGYGIEGLDPAARKSFIITEDIGPHITLEDLTRSWSTEKPDKRFKWDLIRQVATIARTLHTNGVNHRDFYICHLLLPDANSGNAAGRTPTALFLIDLHRVQIRNQTPERWIIKDLGGLLFSSMDIGLTRRDLYRFIKSYRQKSLKESIGSEKYFWEKVYRRARNLYVSHWKKEPPM